MPIIQLETEIFAPIKRVFDLARSIDLHAESMSRSQERAVGGVTSGLIDVGETVTWAAVHFGVPLRLTSKITVCDWPRHLQDVMVGGPFSRFTHDHFFSSTGLGTIMSDVFDYDSPLGFLGKIADYIFLEAYMTKLLNERNRLIKETAESDHWKRFIP